MLLSLLVIFSVNAWAQVGSKSGGGGGGGFTQTYTQRSAERFNILDWLTEQKRAKSAQDAKYGSIRKGMLVKPDLVLHFASGTSKLNRDGTDLGEVREVFGRAQLFFDDVFTSGNSTRLLNVDIGFEGFYGQTSEFKVDANSSQLKWERKCSGGGLLLRPLGRSSQDTGLTVKGGYIDIKQSGFWGNTTSEVGLFGPYLGAEAKIYLANFLGLRTEYTAALETTSDSLAGKWKMQRFTYGAFLELFMLELEAHAGQAEWTFTPTTTSVSVKDNEKLVGFSASLFF